MAEKTDLNISPYYDDYSQDKNFHKVLFRASRPLQARELTQSQSILQNQIERFGNHIFEEGSIVTGAQTDVDMELYFVKVKSSNPNVSGDSSVETYRKSFHGKIIQGKTTGVVGKVVTSTAETTDDKTTLFVRYQSQGTDTSNSFTFSAGEELQEVTVDENGAISSVGSNNNEFTVDSLTVDSNPTGRASIANISEGVLFLRGFFVKVPAQELILEKYSGAPSYRVGLTITEKLISSAEDNSLLDNSQGTTNENAAGADRLKFDVVLSKYALTTTTDTDFVELVRVNKGLIELKVDKPIYNEIEHTMARRTFDANGDFVVRQFVPNLKEHLDTSINGGVYTKSNGGDESKFVMQVSPGKAYVKGYEIDKIGTTTVPLNKARSVVSLDNANTPIRLGNKLRVTSVHSLPEFGNDVGNTALDPFQVANLVDYTPSAGAAVTGNPIGLCRVRNVDEHTTGVYNLYLFDIKMFTKINLTSISSSSEFSVGDKITEDTTGATGIVSVVDATNNILMLHDVVGTFTVGNGLSSKGLTSTTKSAGAITGVRTYNIDRVRGVIQESNDSNNERFTASVVLDSVFNLTGTVIFGSTTTITGFGTKFTTELKEGDVIHNPTSGQNLIISAVTSDILATVTVASSGEYQGGCSRLRATLYDQNQTANIFAWPRNWVKTHTGESIQIRRQFTVALTNTGTFTIDTGSNGTFGAVNKDNFTIACIQGAGGTLSAGDLVDPDTLTNSVSPSGSGQQITFSGINANNSGATVKVSYTVTITDPVNRTKTLRSGRMLKVGTSSATNTVFYGTAYDNKEITLGVPDVYKVRGIYEGVSGDAVPPSGVITTTTGTFVVNEEIVGQTSDARANIVTLGSNPAVSWFYYTNDKVFTNTESIIGQTSGAVGTIASVTAGSPNIKNRYFFDNGQRDGYYDLSKLVLKPGEPTPNNKILVIFDYFQSSGGGDYFDVNSYNSIPYSEIPVYSPNKVDLGGLEPDGTFELSDSVDFRPLVGQILGSTTFATNTSQDPTDSTSIVDLSDTSGEGARYAPFGYESGRSFLGTRTNIATTNASAVDTPVSGSSVVGDISFYVGRIDKVFLHKSGMFQVSTGNPSLSPTKPKAIDESIEMFELSIPPYTNKLNQIRVRSQDHRRYTMKDIGKINNRVTNLERITSLSLLEKDTQSKQILDADGFDRYKSGFLVDNFRGHKIGDVNHPDYKCSIDTKMGMLRPQSYQQFFDIGLNSSASSNFTKTGDLITLPFTELAYVDQNKASRSINVNPYHVFAFVGNVKLTPETDIWQDTEQLPEVRINREGNFDAVLSDNTNALGTVWNSWQTTWAGEPSVVSSEVQATSNGSWSGDPAQGGEWVAGLEITREITETPEIQTRTGVTTSVVEDFVETRNDRIVSVSIVPFMRARTIEIDATNLKPGSNHYFFFDNIDVNRFVRPYSGTYSQDGGTTVTSNCKTDGNGRLRAYFELPNNSIDKFATGQRELRITSSANNLSNPASNGSAVYQAQGLLQASQTEIVSTRNGRVVMERLQGSRSMSRRGENLNSAPTDTTAPPLPQAPAEIVRVNDPPQDMTPPVIPDPTPAVPDPVAVIPVESPLVFTPPVVSWPEPPIEVPIIIDDMRDRFVDRIGRSSRLDRGWGDPLAQSFLCEADGGMFLSSVDVFFETKDTSMPVSVEVRTMVNGYPGQTVLPFSTVTHNPSAVNTSADGSVATTFTFDSPVYVEENVEYALVVYSNSNEYNMFISRMGEKDLATGQTIAGQPYAGSLFLSQNASTWTAEQTDDMKIKIKTCRFDTSKISNLKFENDALPSTKLQNNPIETFVGQNYVKVYNYLHGMYDSVGNKDNVVMSGLTGDKTGSILTLGSNSVNATPTDGTYNNLAISSGSTSGTGATLSVVVASGAVTSCLISNPGGGYLDTETLVINNFDANGTTLSVEIGTVGETLGSIPVAALNTTFTQISNRGIDSYTVIPDLSSFNFVSGYTALVSTVSGGSNALSTRNYYFDAIHTMIPSIAVKNTQILASIQGTGMSSPEGVISGTAYTKSTTSTFITLNDNAFFDAPSIVASTINEQNEMSSTKSFSVNLQLASFNQNISPVIDVGTIGCIGIANRLNNIDSSADVPTGTTYIPSTEPEGDSNAMVYVTRKVNLKTPATSLKVIGDFFRPPTTDIKVMYKIIKNDEDTPLDDIGFQFFNTNGSPDVSVENDGRNFKEYEFTANDLPEFSAFAVKIVGQGTNTSVVPLITALRCMALA